MEAGNDVFVREFSATHSLQQWVFAHDASLSISTSNSNEWYGIPKSDVFLSVVKFYVWFCDSFMNLPYSKSIHWRNQRRHQCAHWGRPPPWYLIVLPTFLNFLYNLFRLETVQPLPGYSLISFSAIILEFVQIFNRNWILNSQHCTPYLHFKCRVLYAFA